MWKSQIYITMISAYFCLAFFSESLANVLDVPKVGIQIYKIVTVLIVTVLFVFLSIWSKAVPNYKFYIFLSVQTLNFIIIFISYKRDSLLSIRGVMDFCVMGLNALLFYFVLDHFRIPKEELEYFLRRVYFVIIASAVYNIVINFDEIFKVFSPKGNTYDTNNSSFFGNRNTFSAYLFLGIIIGSLIKRLNSKNNGIILFCNVFLVFNLLLTMSRTALLGTVVFLILVFTFTKKISMTQKAILVLLLFVGLMIIKSTVLWTFVTDKLVRKKMGNTGRTEIWLKSISINRNIFEKIFGVGYGARAQKLIAVIKRANSHNTYITFYNLGGLFFLNLMVCLMLKSILRAIKIGENEIKLLIISSQVSIAICMVFDNYNFLGTTADSQIMLFLFGSLPIIFSKANRQSTIKFRSNYRYLAISNTNFM